MNEDDFKKLLEYAVQEDVEKKIQADKNIFNQAIETLPAPQEFSINDLVNTCTEVGVSEEVTARIKEQYKTGKLPKEFYEPSNLDVAKIVGGNFGRSLKKVGGGLKNAAEFLYVAPTFERKSRLPGSGSEPIAYFASLFCNTLTFFPVVGASYSFFDNPEQIIGGYFGAVVASNLASGAYEYVRRTKEKMTEANIEALANGNLEVE